MARELQAFGPIGAVAYGLIFVDGQGTVWNGSGFEIPVSSNWANYVVNFTEQPGTGIYLGNMPASASFTRGTYTYLVKRQIGATPSPSDPEIAQGSLEWTGTAPLSLATQLDATVSSRMVSFTAPNIDSSGRVVLQPTGLDQVLVAGTFNARQTLRYIAAICAGKVSGAGSGLEIFSDLSGTQAVEVFVDQSGNRTNVVYN